MPRGVAAITWDVPEELKGKGLELMIEKALNEALLAHRRHALPVHFTREALDRYGDAYAGACPGPNPKKNKVGMLMKMERGALSAYLKAMPAEARRNYFAQWRREQRDRLLSTTHLTRGLVSTGGRERTKDRNNEVPLFDTGALKALVLGGSATLTGTTFTRMLKLHIPLPYVGVMRKNWKGQGLNKSKALKATTAQEVEAFAANVDAALKAQFDSI